MGDTAVLPVTPNSSFLSYKVAGTGMFHSVERSNSFLHYFRTCEPLSDLKKHLSDIQILVITLLSPVI